MNTAAHLSDSILTAAAVFMQEEVALQPNNYDGMLMTASPSLTKVEGAFNTLEKSPMDRTTGGAYESLLM